MIRMHKKNPTIGSTPVEKPAAVDWRQCKATLTRFLATALGFDDLARINVHDGVRVYFRNGDVAHARSSGKVPQLRIYCQQRFASARGSDRGASAAAARRDPASSGTSIPATQNRDLVSENS
jgi:phosphomannomutase